MNKKKQNKKNKVYLREIKRSMHCVNSEIKNLLKNLKRSIPTKNTSKKQPLFSDKIIQNIKEDGLCQNIFFLQESLAKETVDKRVSLAAESVANWVFTTFGIQKKYVEGEVLQIKKSELDKFIIPNSHAEPLPPTISVRITQPGFQYKGIEFAKPLAEVLK